MPPLHYRVMQVLGVVLVVVSVLTQNWITAVTGVLITAIARMLAVGWARTELAIHGKLQLPPFELGHLGPANYRISRAPDGEICGVEIWHPLPERNGGGYAYTVATHPDKKPDLNGS